MRGDALILFTKPARPGRVKTRLVGELSPEQTAELHAAFTGDLVERLAGGNFHLEVAWALDEGEDVPELTVAGRTLAGRRQEGPDLGARLYHALAAAARDHRAVAAVGSDHPELSAADVDGAFHRLAAGADCVLGPVPDGGYYLVGLRSEAVRRELFEGVAWSTGSVLAETLERARRLGLAVELLPQGHDVDRPDDLEALAARLGEGDAESGHCPRTRALLAAWGLLPAAV